MNNKVEVIAFFPQRWVTETHFLNCNGFGFSRQKGNSPLKPWKERKVKRWIRDTVDGLETRNAKFERLRKKIVIHESDR